MKVEVDIPDRLAESLQQKAIQRWLQSQIDFYNFALLEAHIQEAMKEANVDWDAEFEKAREQAWEENKQRYLRTS